MFQFFKPKKRNTGCRRIAGTRQSTFEILETRMVLSTSYLIHDLASDVPGVAPVTDPNLVNAWGIAVGPVTMWVSSNEKDLSTVYTGDVAGSPFAKNSLEVNIPGGAPTGQVFNSTASDFQVTDGVNTAKALFIFASESGAITGWSPMVPPPAPSHDALPAFQATDDAVYKGIALASDHGSNFLYATDFHNGKIDVLDSNFDLTHLGGSFSDPNIPAGFAPFNIASINGNLYVTYAKRNPADDDDVAGAGLGFIDVFTTDGAFIKRLVTQGKLNAPWGMALAPSNFGEFSGDLLVGNFGDGTIHAYNPATGALKGTLSSSSGHPLVTEGLWGLAFGNGTTAGNTNTLFFTAGPDDEEHGLIGEITANPQGTSPVSATLHDGTLTVLGSRGNDNIDVEFKHNKIEVSAGSKKIGSFDPSAVATMEIFGLLGNDKIAVSSKIKVTTLIDGGEGNDQLGGGGGSTAIVGGAGADSLFAGAGRSVLIGGTGGDAVKADRGGAIVIGGSTAHDTDSAALLQILNEWSSGDSLAVRKDKLQTGADGLPPLNDTTVVDDGVRDALFARKGENWTFSGVHDIVV